MRFGRLQFWSLLGPLIVVAVPYAFCRFAEAMQAQAAAGWPDIAGPPDVRKSGQELIDDCR